ncbi:hypothetical protein niasHT_015913 [Heterodera trifolii]|uniref:Uncharacterized protein n=1 Tax=Heterodera trifolii TaxID=157864 RepID=A0ABD2LFG9_9BILA
MNIVSLFLVTLCSIFIVHFPKCAQAVTKKVTFGKGRPSTVQAWHNGQWLFNFETKKDREGILYANIDTRQWTGLNDDDSINFLDKNGTLLREIRVRKLRLKKEIFFQSSRTPYEISVFCNEQFMFEESATYLRSKLKNYLEIDPEKWLQRNSDDVITFKSNRSNGEQVTLGRATVQIMREVAENSNDYDLDFSQSFRHYFRNEHDFLYYDDANGTVHPVMA